MTDKIEDYNNGEKRTRRPRAFHPLLIAIFLIIGIYIGSNLKEDNVFVIEKPGESNPNKLVKIINYIDNYYVDSIQKNTLIEGAIASMLEDLDPHSYYISTEEYQAVQESMEGNFEGIGVEFMIQKDTLMVVSPIDGGPSQEAGILAGDKIIVVDGDTLAGKELTNQLVMKKLKGEKGSSVHIEIQRRNQDELLPFTIVRDKIPIYSVVASFMVEDEVGYIKVNRFAKNTYEEFLDAAINLDEKGAKKMILDLRGNGGGYLDPATKMVEEFLNKGEMIVYTEGRSSPKEVIKSRKNGRFQEMELVVLINQGSASASEIVSGALQDHDRSITVGRRSFGKGLVQNEIPFSDHSALRLTVARYYTPTGRCIQKPYGGDVDYDEEYYHRYDSGELYSADSVSFADSLKYTTPGGRTVYGGGGIMPDVFVALDTMGGSHYLNELSYLGYLRQFGFEYADTHREQLSGYGSMSSFTTQFEITDDILEDLMAFAEEEGLDKKPEELNDSRDVISTRIKAYIAKNIFGDQAFYFVSLEDDIDFKKGMEVLGSYDQFFAESLLNEEPTSIE